MAVWGNEIMQVKYLAERLAHRGDQKVELPSLLPRVAAVTMNGS